MTKIAIIGVGQMGGAIIKGLSKNPNNELIGENPVNPRVDQLAAKYNFTVINTIPALLEEKPEIVVLTTPAILTLNIASNLTKLADDTLIISAAAGISHLELSKVLPNKQIARIIPNTPVAINAGTIGVYLPETMPENVQAQTKNFLSQLGDVISVKEAQLSIVGTIGGCGPAFVDIFLDALGDAGVLNGLPRSLANQVAASMVKGSASLASESKQAPALLRDQVCSPGGTTIKGVASLEKNGFRNAVIEAVNEANKN